MVTVTGTLLLIEILRFAVAVCAVGVSESVTCTVKLEVPVAVGVPVIAPVAAFSVSPPGRLPLVMAQVYGDTPPAAATLALYPALITPVGSEVVVTLKVGALMVMLRAAEAVLAGDSESVTLTVKLMTPTSGPVGVPVIAPVAALSESPAGKLPTVTAQEYGEVPPAAAKVWL